MGSKYKSRIDLTHSRQDGFDRSSQLNYMHPGANATWRASSSILHGHTWCQREGVAALSIWWGYHAKSSAEAAGEVG